MQALVIILSVITGGIILFFLLWMWFSFEQGRGGGGQYPAQYQQDNSSQSSFDGGYAGGRYASGGYRGFDNRGYVEQPVYRAPRRIARPCYAPCY